MLYNNHFYYSIAFYNYYLFFFLILPLQISAQVKILSPPALVNAAHSAFGNYILPGATATFGAPAYGESFVGRLFYVPSPSLYCTNDYELPIQQILNNVPIDGSSSGMRRIFLQKRGACTFVQKVNIAERLGADAVLLIDSETSQWTNDDITSVILGDDGSGRHVNIPSVMITSHIGKLIMSSIENNHTDILIQLEWSIPQNSTVHMDFWTEAGSSDGQRFLKNYAYHAMSLRGYLSFQPHYTVYSFSSEGEPYLAESELCWPHNTTLCSNPPNSGGFTITGRQVLEEDVRQLCLWESTVITEAKGFSTIKFSLEWWEYIRQFTERCSTTGVSKLDGFNEECSYGIMQAIPGVDLENVRACVKDKAIVLLTREKNNKAWSHLALRINSGKYLGPLDPVSVSRAVCSAFEKPPEICSKLTGVPSVKPVENETHSNDGSTRAILTTCVLIAAIFTGALYFYQYYIKKSMRASLRHEVMLEVRSQLQEYHSLDDYPNHQKAPMLQMTQC